MLKMKKWLAILMVACMMFTVLPAANMEEMIEDEAVYAAMEDSDIEAPDELEAPVGEVVVTLGGEPEEAAPASASLLKACLEMPVSTRASAVPAFINCKIIRYLRFPDARQLQAM